MPDRDRALSESDQPPTALEPTPEVRTAEDERKDVLAHLYSAMVACIESYEQTNSYHYQHEKSALARIRDQIAAEKHVGARKRLGY